LFGRSTSIVPSSDIVSNRDAKRGGASDSLPSKLLRSDTRPLRVTVSRSTRCQLCLA